VRRLISSIAIARYLRMAGESQRRVSARIFHRIARLKSFRRISPTRFARIAVGLKNAFMRAVAAWP
jgi:hypothetical protein